MTNDNISNEPHTLSVSAEDILGAIAFQASRIIAAISQHAAGYPFPESSQIQGVVDRMSALNGTLMTLQKDQAHDLNSQFSIKEKLN